MLNVDIKILPKALAKRLKEVLSCLISAQQTAYLQNRNMGEGGRLISDIIEIANTRQMVFWTSKKLLIHWTINF